MKSSSSIIRASDGLSEIQKWSPAEFEKTDLFSAELIHTSTMNLFGSTNVGTKQQKRNLVKAENAEISVRQWQHLDMDSKYLQTPKKTPQAWIPFLEQPNPKKMADKLIDEARIKSEEIISAAKVTIDQVRMDAYNEGVENAKAEMRETLQGASAIIKVAREWRSDMMSQAEPMIMDLIKKMAQKMFGEGIVLDNTTMQQHFASVIETARSLDDLRIFMNPLDAVALGPDWREYQASLLGHKVEIISNESIKRGGCYIQGEWGTADALVETQLETILTQFSEVEQPIIGDE